MDDRPAPPRLLDNHGGRRGSSCSPSARPSRIVESVLRAYGIPVDEPDARRLVASLVAEGTPAAISAANMIGKGVDRGLYAIGLARDERDAVLAVREEPPASLAELRGALGRDHRDRLR